MLYAILAYHEEGVIQAMSEAEDVALVGKMMQVRERLGDSLGPAARLGATALAATIRDGLVIDGPFAETKEQLLGFHVIDSDLDGAIAAAKALQAENPSAVYEVRPIVLFVPGKAIQHTDAGLEAVRP